MDRLTLPETTSEPLMRTRAGLLWRVVARAARTGSWTDWEALLTAELEAGKDADLVNEVEAGESSRSLLALLDGTESDPEVIERTSEELGEGLIYYLESLSTKERVRSTGRIVNLLHLVTQTTRLVPFAQLEQIPFEDQIAIWDGVLSVLAAKDQSGGVSPGWLEHVVHIPEVLSERWAEQVDEIELTDETRAKLRQKLAEAESLRAGEVVEAADEELGEAAVSRDETSDIIEETLDFEVTIEAAQASEPDTEVTEDAPSPKRGAEADVAAEDSPPPEPAAPEVETALGAAPEFEPVDHLEVSGELAAVSPEAFLALEKRGAYDEHEVDASVEVTADTRRELPSTADSGETEAASPVPGQPLPDSSTDVADESMEEADGADEVAATHPERPALRIEQLVEHISGREEEEPPASLEDATPPPVSTPDSPDETIRWRTPLADETLRFRPRVPKRETPAPEPTTEPEPEPELEAEPEIEEPRPEEREEEAPRTDLQREAERLSQDQPVELVGAYAGKPAPRIVRVLGTITGLIVVAAVFRTLARFLFGSRREGRLRIEGEQVILESTRYFLGSETSRTRRSFGPKGLLTVAREVRYPQIYLFVGLFALCAGALAGTMVFLDGRLAGFEEWMRVGLLLIIGGLIIDFLFAVVAASRPGKTSLIVTFAPKSTFRIVGVDERAADEMLDALVELANRDSG